MKKTFIMYLSMVLLMSILLCACKNVIDVVADPVTQAIILPENTIKEEEIMDFGTIFTKEEFIEYINAHNDLRLSEKDFSDNNIDIEEFIEYYNLSKEKVEILQLDLKSIVEEFAWGEISKAIKAYLPQKLIIADSTNEEYERFKDNYFRSIGKAPEFGRQLDDFEKGSLKEGTETSEFIIGQTIYINQFIEQNANWKLLENPCSFDYAWEEGGFWILPLYLSKSGKFFIAFYSGPNELQTVQVFCEIDD